MLGRQFVEAKIPMCYLTSLVKSMRMLGRHEFCYATTTYFPQSFSARIHIGRIHFHDDGELIGVYWQSLSVCTII
jgi:hypothetical protein